MACAEWRWCLRPDWDFCQSLKSGDCQKCVRVPRSDENAAGAGKLASLSTTVKPAAPMTPETAAVMALAAPLVQAFAAEISKLPAETAGAVDGPWPASANRSRSPLPGACRQVLQARVATWLTELASLNDAHSFGSLRKGTTGALPAL